MKAFYVSHVYSSLSTLYLNLIMHKFELFNGNDLVCECSACLCETKSDRLYERKTILSYNHDYTNLYLIIQ